MVDDTNEPAALMCATCGEFVLAHEVGDELVPESDACPNCGEEEFVEPE